jgi:hypothetical protein
VFKALGQFRNDHGRVAHGQQDACAPRDPLFGAAVSQQVSQGTSIRAG